MNNKAESDLIKKLDILIRINIAMLIDGKDFRRQVEQLNNIGLSPKQIAEVTGKTANNVSVTLNQLKRKKTTNKL